MNAMALRYEIYNALVRLARPRQRDEIDQVTMVSPVPGEPLKIRVRTLDPYDEPPDFTISIVED